MTDQEWDKLKEAIVGAFGQGIIRFFEEQPNPDYVEGRWRQVLEQHDLKEVNAVVDRMYSEPKLRPRGFAQIPSAISAEVSRTTTRTGVRLNEVECQLCDGCGWVSIFSPRAMQFAREGKYHDCHYIQCSIVCSCLNGDRVLLNERHYTNRYNPAKHVFYRNGSQQDIERLCEWLGVESCYVSPEVRGYFAKKNRKPVYTPKEVIELVPEPLPELKKVEKKEEGVSVLSPRREMI